MKQTKSFCAALLAGTILSLGTVVTAQANVAQGLDFTQLSPEQIAGDVSNSYNPRTGARELSAASFDPFEEAPDLAGSARLRSADGAIDIDGQRLGDGALLDINFYYNSPSSDPYAGRGYEAAVFLDGSAAPIVRRDRRVLECSTRVDNVVYDHTRYYDPGYGYGRGIFRPTRGYYGHHGFGAGFGSGYGYGRGYGYNGSRHNGRYGTYRAPLSDYVRDRLGEDRRNPDRSGTRTGGPRTGGTRTGNTRGGERTRTAPPPIRAMTAPSRNGFAAPHRAGPDIPTRLEAAPETSRPTRTRTRTRSTVKPAPRTRAIEAPARSGTSEPRRAAPTRPTRVQAAPSKQRTRSNPKPRPQSRTKTKTRSNPKPVSRPRPTPRREAPSRSRTRLDFFPGDAYGGRSVVTSQSVDCAREETLRLFIPAERLDAARFDGMTVLVLDRDGQEWPVYVPPNYIEGFRLAATGQVRPTAVPQPVMGTRGGYPQPSLQAAPPANCPAGTTPQPNGTCLLN